MKIHWILLAAGLSRRFGENKLLYPVNGKKLYRYSLERMAALAEKRQERLVVVTSHEAIRQELAGEKVEVIWNPKAETGIASSIHCAIRHLGISEDAAYLFSVADQPFLRQEDLGAFIEGFLLSGKAMGCMAHQGVCGEILLFFPGSMYSGSFHWKEIRAAKKYCWHHRSRCLSLTANRKKLSMI